jgi:hypothetical protein
MPRLASLTIVSLTMLALAGPAAADVTPTVKVQALSTGTMPTQFAGTKGIFGQKVLRGDPIPNGAVVLQATFAARAGQDIVFSLMCPEHYGNAGLGNPSPALAGGGFSPRTGVADRRVGMRFPNIRVTGQVTAWVLCIVKADVPRSRIAVRREGTSPVTFPRTYQGPGLRRGQALGRGQSLVVIRLIGFKDVLPQQASYAPAPCPGSAQLLSVTARPPKYRVGLTGGDWAQVLPVSTDPGRAITLYGLCGRPAT